MSTVFLHPKRKTYYHRAQIPKKLRSHFKGRVGLYEPAGTGQLVEISLTTSDYPGYPGAWVLKTWTA